MLDQVLSVEDQVEIQRMTNNPFFDSHIGSRNHMSVVSTAEMAIIEKGGAVLLPHEKDFSWAYYLEEKMREKARDRVAARKSLQE